MASRAEASSTTLFIARGLAAFGNQFVHQRGTRLHMLADQPLSPLNVAFQGGDAQFVALNPQNDLVTNTDAQPLAKRSRNHHSPVLVDPHACFQHPVTFPLTDTILPHDTYPPRVILNEAQRMRSPSSGAVFRVGVFLLCDLCALPQRTLR